MFRLGKEVKKKIVDVHGLRRCETNKIHIHVNKDENSCMITNDLWKERNSVGISENFFLKSLRSI